MSGLEAFLVFVSYTTSPSHFDSATRSTGSASFLPPLARGGRTMSALASRAAHVFSATRGERTPSLKKRPRGVVDVLAPVVRGKMARGTSGGVGAEEYSAPKQKRVLGGFDAKVVPAPPARRHLKEAAPAGKDGARILASKRRPEAPSAEEVAKRRKTSSSVRRATTPATVQRPMSKLIDKGKEALKRRRLEEIALAREKFRLELIEVEKAAMPDETIYPEDLEELGLTKFQYAVTPTRRQALRGAG